MSKVALGDCEAFRSVYDQTSPKLFGYALRIVRKPALAENVLQESFVAVWRNASAYESTLSAPMTWMTTIVRNKAFDLLRATVRYVEIGVDNFDLDRLTSIVGPDLTPPEKFEMSRLACNLARCMAQLDSAHRQVIYMAFYNDLSYSEIANKQGLPIGTVKSWIRRSLEHMGTCLKKLED